MFDEGLSDVVAAVEALAVPVCCEDLAALVRVRDVLDAKVSAGVGEVDAAELWDVADATPMSAWLRQPLRVRDSSGGPGRSPAQARASALADIAKFFLDHHDHPHPTPRNRPHVGVVIDWDALRARGQGRLIDADQPVSPEDVRQILCDAGVFRILTLGRTTKVVSPRPARCPRRARRWVPLARL